MNFRIHLICFVGLFQLIFTGGFVVASNKPNYNIDELEARYAKHNAIYLKRSRAVVIDIVDDSLVVTQQNSEATLLLNDNSKIGSVNSVYSSTFKQVSNLDAYTLYPNKKGYKKMQATDIKTSSSMGESVFYDDSKQTTITYPMVLKGSIMHLNYDETFTDAHFLHGFYFQDYLPTLEVNLSVKVHKNIDFNFRLFNDSGYNIAYTYFEKGDYKFYNWKLENVKKGKQGNKYSDHRQLFPHVKYFLGDVRFQNRTDKYFSNTDDLYAYYSSFIENIDTAYSADFLKLVQEITAHCTSDCDKARNILYWVQDNIRYVAFEEGFRGFVPHSANLVFHKRYGDCKDMASLIVGMMNAAGVKAYYTWVGTRHIPYRYEELPTLAVDNHMVASFFVGDSVVVLDGTVGTYPYGLVPHHIQGKEVLIAISKNDYHIKTLSETPASVSYVRDSVYCEIVDNTLKGRGVKAFAGYNHYEIASAMLGVKPDREKKQVTNLLTKGNNTFKLDTFQLSNIFNRDTIAEIMYQFQIDNYVKKLNDELYVNMNLDQSFKDAYIDTTFSLRPIGNDFKYKEQYVSVLKIPEGYEVAFLPEDVAYTDSCVSCAIRYQKNENTVVQHTSILLNFLDLKPRNFEAWDGMVKSLNKAYRQTIALKRSKVIDEN